jgi:hypothetical protein
MTTGKKKSVGRISEVEKFGSRKCHFAMTQAFSEQMECLGALKMERKPQIRGALVYVEL